jgi:hypothetical protein
MLGSENKFFYSDVDRLIKTKKLMVDHLKIHNTDKKMIDLYELAYDYFVLNPEKYDGATVLKDMLIIPGLDMWAMLHDYIYIMFNVAVSWKYKFYADKMYAEEMERMGHSWEVTWVRFGLLMITHLLFTPYELIRGKIMNSNQRYLFSEIYKQYREI